MWLFWILAKLKVSHGILLYKLSSTQLDKSVIHWVSNWLAGQAPRTRVNVVTLGWWTVTSGFSQGSVVQAVLFIVFINYLGARIECTLSTFADNTNLGRAVDSLGVREVLQRDMDRLDSQANTNHKKLTSAAFSSWDGEILVISTNQEEAGEHHKESDLVVCCHLLMAS